MILVICLFFNQFIIAQDKSLWKDVKYFSKSSGEMVKEGVKIIKEDPNTTANKIMNDKKYQKNLQSTVEEHSHATERLSNRIENTHNKVKKTTPALIDKTEKVKIKK